MDIQHSGRGSIYNNNGGTQNVHTTGDSSNLYVNCTIINNHDKENQNEYYRIKNWLSPVDPSSNHYTARERHEPHTGTWLLQHVRYKSWKAGEFRHLWLNGKAGCGKTVLCSTVIEDLQQNHRDNPSVILLYFYFTFSDERKQSYDSLLLSLAAQLARHGPAQPFLRTLRLESNDRKPEVHHLEHCFVEASKSFEQVIIVLDALDELPEAAEVRRVLLERLNKLLLRGDKLRLFATSRYLQDIADALNSTAKQINVKNSDVSPDIELYVERQLSCVASLAILKAAVKLKIQHNIRKRADGMFRWAYLLLDELRRLKHRGRIAIEDALARFPQRLDEVYARILGDIGQEHQQHAFILLTWIAYAGRPLTLDELVETLTIKPDGSVDPDERGNPRDIIELLPGLVIVGSNQKEDYASYYAGYEDENDAVENEEDGSDADEIEDDEDDENEDEDEDEDEDDEDEDNREKDNTVRLAHFTVQEYLESLRIRDSAIGCYHLDPSEGHHSLTRSCVTYIFHYTDSNHKRFSWKDHGSVPLLAYAIHYWPYHSLRHGQDDLDSELRLLGTDYTRKYWQRSSTIFTGPNWFQYGIGTALYCASFERLHSVVEALLSRDADVNAQGGEYGTPLAAAASLFDNEAGVRILLDAGADVNAQGGKYGNALQMAVLRNDEGIVRILLDAGADVNAQGGKHGNALHTAMQHVQNNEDMVRMLIDAGADVNAQGELGTALIWASIRGDPALVRMLLDAGADVNVQGEYGSALIEASSRGEQDIVRMLLDAGADVNAQGGEFGSALIAASTEENTAVTRLLLDAGVDVNAQSNRYGSALQLGASYGNEQAVQLLLERGADPNMRNSHWSALQEASWAGRAKLAQLLLDHGANVDDQGPNGTALQLAYKRDYPKYSEIVQILLKHGATP